MAWDDGGWGDDDNNDNNDDWNFEEIQKATPVNQSSTPAFGIKSPATSNQPSSSLFPNPSKK